MNEITAIEKIELNLVVNCIYQCSGYDFSGYCEPSLIRNLKREVERNQLLNISELIPLMLHDSGKLFTLIQNLSVNVTHYFRDPEIFKSLISELFPILKSFPFIKIWHAGCASGEEVYSLAILLEEHNLLDRTLIYATDFNHQVLSKAKKGIYHLDDVEEARERYLSAGGSREFIDYFQCRYDVAKIKDDIRKRITFAHHNLATDSVFGEMQLIICKNVLIYFNKKLKFRVIKLFYESLYYGGYLSLGTTETLDFFGKQGYFCEVENVSHTYKKTSNASEFTIENRGFA